VTRNQKIGQDNKSTESAAEVKQNKLLLLLLLLLVLFIKMLPICTERIANSMEQSPS
jgi:hypothetical protein